jgi:hypothetical protein
VADLNTCVETIKASHPQIPVMVVFAPLSVRPSPVVPEKADWVGFDYYGPMSNMVGQLNTLRGLLKPHQRLWLVPPTVVKEGFLSDAALAQGNWAYYDLARTDPRIFGLLNYGLWAEQAPATIPLTVAAQRAIGSHLLGR